MGTRQMRVSEDLYARVQSENRADETLAETLDRLVDGYSLTDFADDMAEIDDPHPDPEELEREFEEADRRARDEIEDQIL